MLRKERSAGFVVCRAAPDLPGGRVYLLLNYGRHWDFPKGHVEKGETDLQAAIRELAEETGIRAIEAVDGFRSEIDYYFRSRRKGVVHKTVVFFLAHTGAVEVTLSDEHVGYEFLDFEPCMQRLTYSGAREVLRAARDFLETGATA